MFRLLDCVTKLLGMPIGLQSVLSPLQTNWVAYCCYAKVGLLGG